MKIKVKKTDTFIPEWNGNREEKDPIKIVHRFLTAGERDDYVGIEPVTLKDGEPEITVRQDNPGMTKRMITRIENLEVEVGTDTVRVDDAGKLYSTPGIPSELIKEIEGAMAEASAVIEAGPLK